MKRNYIKKDEVIKLMNEGWEIFTDRTNIKGRKGQTIYSSLTFILAYPNKGDRNIHHSTINSLKDAGIIQRHAPYHLLNN